MSWGSPVERERRNRIRLTVAAYAYEVESHSVITDAEFDDLSLEINPSTSTGNNVVDDFFRRKFNPCTGMWVHDHPELDGIKRLYKEHYI